MNYNSAPILMCHPERPKTLHFVENKDVDYSFREKGWIPVVLRQHKFRRTPDMVCVNTNRRDPRFLVEHREQAAYSGKHSHETIAEILRTPGTLDKPLVFSSLYDNGREAVMVISVFNETRQTQMRVRSFAICRLTDIRANSFVNLLLGDTLMTDEKAFKTYPSWQNIPAIERQNVYKLFSELFKRQKRC